MSPPIVSRFDLFFIILDEASEATDNNIAKHIVNFHRFLEGGVRGEYTRVELLRYLQYAKGLTPQVTISSLSS
jgi:DNA replication licensing factor MCM6